MPGEGYGQVSSDPRVPERFAKSIDLFNHGHCQDAWNEIWRLAADRDYYALYLLLVSAMAPPFKLSGISQSEIRSEILLPMAFYAPLAPNIDNDPISPDGIRTGIIPEFLETPRADADIVRTKTVLECLKSKEVFGVCVNLAIKSHLIPSYPKYIATVNQLNRSRLRVECNTSGGAVPTKNTH